MAVRTGRGAIVLVGCAHGGLVNSILAASEAVGKDGVRAVIGGAHMGSMSREEIQHTVEEVARLEPEFVALGHCTGERAEDRFAEVLGRRFEPLRTGSAWVFD